MTTSPIPAAGTNELPNKSLGLKATDFINMMVTQLQNQDPLQPTSNQDLLAQMSQIGQMQAATDLQTSLKTISLQNNISSAGNLIGKMVAGQDERGAPLNGLVNSVKVVDGAVSLELDNGKELSLSNVTGISALSPTAAK